jgi:hypothetical protein
MNMWRSLACLVVFALAQHASAQAQLTEFQDGQIASANAVNVNFKVLLAQTVKLQRPAFRRKPGFNQTVVVPATPAQPGRVAFGSEVRSFTQDLEVNLTVSGLGGLDTGAVQGSKLYYVYLVSGVQPSSVAGVASLNSPAIGPVGFGTQWSYLGSFITDSVANIPRFTFSKGRYLRFSNDAGSVVGTQSTTPIQFTLRVPEHATEVYARFSLGSLGTQVSSLEAGPDQATMRIIIQADGQALTNGVPTIASVPLFDGPVIFLRVSGNCDSSCEPLGWTEDPTLFQ